MYKRDDPIVFFTGTLRTQQAFTKLCEKEPWRRAYALVFSEHGEVMDCFDQYQKGLCLASYSNSPNGCFDITTSKKAVENCRLVVNVKDKTMTIKCGVNKESIRSSDHFVIPPHTELLWDYGDSYISYNQ